MQLCKVQLPGGKICVGVCQEDHIIPLDSSGNVTLTDVLHSEDPESTARRYLSPTAKAIPRAAAGLLPPLDRQEVWAAGVTYKRSREARERESVGAARFYDLVYTAPRPELFFKANPFRVVGPGGRVRIRRDSRWNVPEPELALVLSPQLKLVGFTIGNDMSSRDIEGENPLYLPQAKVYDGCCALGPVITLASAMPPRDQIEIRLTIERHGKAVFSGQTSIASMARTLEDLISWLGRETSFPDGAILLTGTGIVPADDFTLALEDRVAIQISGIGLLENVVEQS